MNVCIASQPNALIFASGYIQSIDLVGLHLIRKTRRNICENRCIVNNGSNDEFDR